MRILMLSSDFLPSPGGISGHVYELSRQLAARGHQVDLIAGYNKLDSDLPLPNMPAGVQLVFHRGFSHNVPGYILMSLLMWRVASKQLLLTNYDVVHWHNLAWESLVVRFLSTRLPKVFSNHSSGFLRRLKVGWRRRWQLPYLLASADHLIAPSKQRVEETRAIDYSAQQITLISNGVDVNRFQPGSPDPHLLTELNLDATNRTLLFPCRLEKVKGVDLLLRALQEVLPKHPEVRVLLVGDGSWSEKVTQWIVQYDFQDQVRWVGPKTREEMPAIFRLVEVSIMPSRIEGGVPLSALESLASGVPILAVPVGGLQEVVRHEKTGLCIVEEDAYALAVAIEDYLNRPLEQIAQWRQEGRNIVEEYYSWEVIAEQTESVYHMLLKRAAIS